MNENLLSYLIERLDYLIGFLDISSEESFNKIRYHKLYDEYESVGEIYNQEYQIYQNQITISALLLGYAHFEAFLSDLIRNCLLKNPRILIAKGKAQKRNQIITYEEFLLSENSESLLNNIIEKEVKNIMYKPILEIIDYLEVKLKLSWTYEVKPKLFIANTIRNCCMHNNCKVNKRLAENDKFVEGEEIMLTAGDVHDFGITARTFC